MINNEYFGNNDNNTFKYAFSLGWKSDCRSFEGYTPEDIRSMKDIIEKYDPISYSQGGYIFMFMVMCDRIFVYKNLIKITCVCLLCTGVVLAVNARVIAKDPYPFDSILKQFPSLQLLIWTGTGEPPISANKIATIKKHFEDNKSIHQIGFDCQV